MMSSICFIFMLLIMIIILYTFFLLIKCPPSPLELLRRHRPTDLENLEQRNTKMANEADANNNNNNNNIELVIASSSKLRKDADCPVCLSVFVEGEELRQLNYCKHLFHKSCIDKWLSSQSNCPVCRAFVGEKSKLSKEKQSRVLPSSRNRNRDDGRHDLWQGLPDSAGLV